MWWPPRERSVGQGAALHVQPLGRRLSFGSLPVSLGGGVDFSPAEGRLAADVAGGSPAPGMSGRGGGVRLGGREVARPHLYRGFRLQSGCAAAVETSAAHAGYPLGSDGVGRFGARRAEDHPQGRRRGAGISPPHAGTAEGIAGNPRGETPPEGGLTGGRGRVSLPGCRSDLKSAPNF